MNATSITKSLRYKNVKILPPEFEDKACAATGIKDIAFMVVVGANGKVRSFRSDKMFDKIMAAHDGKGEKHEVCFEVMIEGHKCKICIPL